MITQKIIKTCEKIMPFETKLRRFFSIKAVRLITLGIISVAFSFYFWTDIRFAHDLDLFLNLENVMFATLVVYLGIAAGAGFFASIKKFTLLKFAIANIVIAPLHFGVYYVFFTRFIDLSVYDPYGMLLSWCVKAIMPIYIFALMISLVTGLWITRRKKAIEV